MEKRIIELYRRDELPRLKNKERLWTLISVMIGLLSLALCIGFLLNTDILNEKKMLIRAVSVSTAAGWIIITIAHFVIGRFRRERKHIEAVLSGEREAVDGSFRLTDERLFVKRGVSMLRVEVSGDGRTKSLQLFEKKKKDFSGVNTKRAYSVHGFVAAYEAEDEMD